MRRLGWRTWHKLRLVWVSLLLVTSTKVKKSRWQTLFVT
jgi:hypothetical protein